MENFIFCAVYAVLQILRYMYIDVIHLVRTQNFLKNEHFLPPDTHTYMCVSEVGNVSFSENLAYILNQLAHRPNRGISRLQKRTWDIIKDL